VTRAFVAVTPPAPVLDAVAATVDGLDVAGARWTLRGQWHVTLQFLGNRADVDAVTAGLQDLQVPAAATQLVALGAFPNARRARVLWIGIDALSDVFDALADEVGARLEPLGHERDSRPYHAHLTLARFKTPADMRPVVESGKDPIGPVWLVDAATVYESRPQPGGAAYVARATLPLAQP
jgi:RNA 2',3'-cyclic 3'-phosphodiesterase